MSFCTSPTVAAKNAVDAPMITMNAFASGAYSISGDIRLTRNTPAVTIVAAWISAETGVGPSIASGSQVCRNNAHRADEQQERGEVGGVPLGPQEGHLRPGDLGRGLEDHVEVDRVGQEEQQEDPQREAEVAHPVDHERLDRGGVGAWLAVVEPDQQIGRDAHAFPAEEHLHQVVGGHQHQHGEGEERQIGEEARLVVLALLPVLVMGHVAEGIEMHERRDGGDHHQHDRGQPVDADRPRRVETARGDPAHQLDMLRLALEPEEHDPAQQHRQEQQPGGDDLPGLLADQPPAKPADQRADEGREEEDGFHDLSPSSC